MPHDIQKVRNAMFVQNVQGELWWVNESCVGRVKHTPYTIRQLVVRSDGKIEAVVSQNRRGAVSFRNPQRYGPLTLDCPLPLIFIPAAREQGGKS